MATQSVRQRSEIREPNPEKLVIEALTAITDRSREARRALVSFLKGYGNTIREGPWIDETKRSPAGTTDALSRDRVSLRQLHPILETLVAYTLRTREPIQLTEYVRQRLARSICTQYRDAEGRVFAVTLDQA